MVSRVYCCRYLNIHELLRVYPLVWGAFQEQELSYHRFADAIRSYGGIYWCGGRSTSKNGPTIVIADAIRSYRGIY